MLGKELPLIDIFCSDFEFLRMISYTWEYNILMYKRKNEPRKLTINFKFQNSI